MSRTVAANLPARSAYAGSSRNSSAYSFIDEPQPAALTTTVSTPAASKTSMVRLAKAIASASRPLCTLSAPQQPLSCGDDDVAALGREHPGGRRVDPGEELALDAAGEHADDGAPWTDGRHPRRQPLGLADRRGERLHRGQRRRQPVQQPAAPHQPSAGRCAGTPSAARAAAAAAGGRGTARRSPRAAAGRPSVARVAARPVLGWPRSAGRTAPPTGRPSRRPCSRGRRRSARPSRRVSGSPSRPCSIR